MGVEPRGAVKGAGSRLDDVFTPRLRRRGRYGSSSSGSSSLANHAKVNQFMSKTGQNFRFEGEFCNISMDIVGQR